MKSPTRQALAPRIPKLIGEALKQDFLDTTLLHQSQTPLILQSTEDRTWLTAP